MKTIAFPAISCGVYGYPIEEACEIAVNTTREVLRKNDEIEKVMFVLFSDGHRRMYEDYLKKTS